MSWLLHIIERRLHWIPSFTILLLIWTEVQVSGVIGEQGVRGLVTGRAVALLVITVTLLAPQLTLCFQSRTRTKATFAMVSAMLVTAALFSMLEALVPPVHKYSDFQVAIQKQLARRSTKNEVVFRGVELREDANDLGFIDQDRQYESSQPRVVFIGDSFLESASSRPLALRVEERLKEASQPVEVINLSKGDTDPDPDYRHKLHQFAFEYQPNHVFVFIYAGNDLHRRYRYTRYRHQTYSVSDEAIEHLRGANIGEQALARLERLNRDGTVLTSKLDLFKRLKGLNLELQRKNLIYLACLGYSRSASLSIFRQTWPNTIERFGVAAGRISKGWKKFRRSVRKKIPNCAATPWEDIRDRYERIYDLPRNQRLEALARFVARDYCQLKDAEPFLQVLQGLDSTFIDALIEESAPLGLLLKGLPSTVAGQTLVKKFDQADVERDADEFVRLLKEFHSAATSHGAGLTVVLIPVAGHVDDASYRFWRPLIDVRGYYEFRKASREAVRERLTSIIPTIDFIDFADQFDGGYWKFDGHWNEKGNDSAARILADYIRALDLLTLSK